MGIDPKNLNWLGLGSLSPNNSLANLLGGLSTPPPPVSQTFPTLLGLQLWPQRGNAINSPFACPAPVKRKVYFAFKYEDMMRVNNVAKRGKLIIQTVGRCVVSAIVVFGKVRSSKATML
jgi:hypothetical protein